VVAAHREPVAKQVPEALAEPRGVASDVGEGDRVLIGRQQRAHQQRTGGLAALVGETLVKRRGTLRAGRRDQHATTSIS